MAASFPLYEARFIQEHYVTSAADALVVSLPACPAGRCRTYLAVAAYPSASETRTLHFSKQGQASTFPVTRPVSQAFNSLQRFPMITEGLELNVYPGEYIQFRRDAATAGSTITIVGQFVEFDLPQYVYEEPQYKRRERNTEGMMRSLGFNRSAPSAVPRPAPADRPTREG